MKKWLITLLLLAGAGALNAQERYYSSYPTKEELKGKQFYVEGGGPGVAFSANFDSRFQKGTTLGWGYRIGLGVDWIDESHYDDLTGWHDDQTHSFATIPFGINYVFGKTSSNHAFEVGAGLTLLTRKVDRYNWDGGKEGNLLGHFTFMYRRQPVDGGFTWRIGFTPIIGTGGDLAPSGAIGLGYSF